MTQLTHNPYTFFPNLDGLRFVAFFAVFVFHFFGTPHAIVESNEILQVLHKLSRQGFLGVNLFFVLSGFLITYFLIQEKIKKQSIDIRKFYLKRVLRIWPLYFLIVFVGFVLYPIAKTSLGNNPYVEPANPVYFLFFASNFNNLIYGCETPMLHVLWSVSIEEQFYLVWPILLALVPLRRLPVAFCLLIVVSLVFRAINVQNGEQLYFNTLSNMTDLIVGATLAWLLCFSKHFTRWMTNLRREIIVTIYTVGIVWIFYRPEIMGFAPYKVFDKLVIAMYFAFIIGEQTLSGRSFYKMENFRFISEWGKYTYGLYCWHFIGLLIALQVVARFTQSAIGLGVEFILALIVSMVISFVCYHVYEKPFLKLKSKLE